jgi:DNA-binding response OmpR family regulator
VRLLVVEDTQDILALLRIALEEEGYAVDTADTATEGLLLARVNEYDGMVLDVMLPDGNGLEIARRLRTEGKQVPILMLTAQGQKADVVRGLDAGADDYLVKPFSIDELKARIRAMVRRGGAKRTEQLACGNVVLNRLTRQILVGGRRISLTQKELALLDVLLLNIGTPVTRTQVLEHVWERQRDPDSNVIDVMIARLRAKLRDAGATARIATERGFGFVLEEATAERAG